jgi:hypothetical protein
MSRVFSIGYALLAEQVRQQGDDLHTNQGNTAPPQLMLVLLEIGTSKITILAIEYILLRFLVKYQIGDVVVSNFRIG